MIANIFSLSPRDGMPAVDVPRLDRPDSRMLDDLGLDERQWNGHTQDTAWRPDQKVLAGIRRAVHGADAGLAPAGHRRQPTAHASGV